MQKSTGAFSRGQVSISFTLQSSLDGGRPGESHRGLFIAISAAMNKLTEVLGQVLPLLDLPYGNSELAAIRSYESDEPQEISFAIFTAAHIGYKHVPDAWFSMLISYALMLIRRPIEATLRGEVAEIGIQPLPWALSDAEILRCYEQMAIERAAS